MQKKEITRRGTKDFEGDLTGKFVTDDIKVVCILNSGSFGHIYIGKNIKDETQIA
jgi:hypothetical protein